MNVDELAAQAARGRNIVAVAKSLKGFQLADPKIAGLLYASSTAGRAGLVASALRAHANAEFAQVTILGAVEGFSPPELSSTVLPWLHDHGICEVHRGNDGKVVTVDSLVLKYDSILAAVAELHESLEPTVQDRACLAMVELATMMPRTESELIAATAKEFGEASAKAALELLTGYRVLSRREGKGLREPVFYSERLWGHAIDRAARALVPLDANQRLLILELVDRVRKHQGLPESLLRRFAKENGAEHLLDLSISVGLLNRTELRMAQGSGRNFLTSPHFYQEMGEDYGEDSLDRVKIFLDSIRNGQHFGHPFTGRIMDPTILLRKLINSGEVGPCTAIGTDYVTSEKAGIVTVRRVVGSQHSLELVQKDTVQKVLDIVRAGSIESDEYPMTGTNIREGRDFSSIEQARINAGEVPGPMAEAERAIITQLREG